MKGRTRVRIIWPNGDVDEFSGTKVDFTKTAKTEVETVSDGLGRDVTTVPGPATMEYFLSVEE